MSEKVKKYEKIELVGESPISKVYLVKNKVTQQEYAMKIVEKEKVKHENYKKVISMLKSMGKTQHTNLLKYEENCSTEKEYIVITEYCASSRILHP
eukprot:TRINITY_DN8462_c0_g1_i4.p2 TRINITY_DN8462_c0_g1~~TRINITY_DN8462_c0_g1_i4.p2  ORF type:complete len:105 (-),score=24.13 TRINITY_DN8462_c0_g1_i4:485-772(-)